MNEDKIALINTLDHKSQAVGLTEEEKAEQAALRKEYIDAIRADLRSSLENISIVNPDGTITDVKDRKKKPNNVTRI